jgi:hypothetical protein
MNFSHLFGWDLRPRGKPFQGCFATFLDEGGKFPPDPVLTGRIYPQRPKRTIFDRRLKVTIFPEKKWTAKRKAGAIMNTKELPVLKFPRE